MSCTLTFVDHHRSPDIRITDEPNVTAPAVATDSDLTDLIQAECREPFDTIITEEGLDSLMAATIIQIHQGGRGEHICIDAPLSEKAMRKMCKRGGRVLALHSRFIYESSLDCFDEVTFLNPWEIGLTDYCVAELLYRAVGHDDAFLRDLTAFGIVGDYNVEDSMETMCEVIEAYPDIFQELQAYRDEGALDKFAVLRSPFKPLLKRLRAPVVIGGVKEAQKMLAAVVNAPSFTYYDLMGESDHPVKKYLDRQYHKFLKLIDDEKMRFEMNRRMVGKVLLFEPKHKSDNVVRELADSIKDDRPDWIVAVKVRHSRREIKYSLRRGTLEVDLGQICRHMGVGGGNPFAAGAVVDDDQEFEDNFITEVNQYIA